MVNQKCHKINIFEDFKVSLNNSTYPYFCEVVVSESGFEFLLFIFFRETHTFKSGFKKEISINLSLLGVVIDKLELRIAAF